MMDTNTGSKRPGGSVGNLAEAGDSGPTDIDQERLRQTLRARRDAIAKSWYRAIAHTGFSPLTAKDVQRQLMYLVDRVIALLIDEPFVRADAQAIGAMLVRLGYIQPLVLSRTQAELGRGLIQDLSPEQASALQPRLIELLSEVAAGFVVQARELILSEQELIRSALLTAREQAQEALRVSEARFRAIYDQAAVAIGIADMTGQILEGNDAMFALLGYSADEYRAKVVDDFTHPDDTESDWELYHELVTGQRDSFQVEKRMFHKDGHLVWGHLTVSLVRDAEGLPQFSIAMIEDITPRKQAEETVKRLNVDLERRVIERTAQLTALNQELAEEIVRRTQAEADRIRLLADEQAARADAEAAKLRLAFLADASSVLASSLEYKATLANLARLSVPFLADWCAVDVLAEDGSLQRLAVGHVDLTKVELVRELQDYYPEEPDALCGVRTVLGSGQPELLTGIPETLALAASSDTRRREILAELHPTSRITVPLIARGQTFGAITLVRSEPDRPYTFNELTLAVDLATRASAAIDNGALYREAQQALAARDEFLSVAAHELKTPITVVRGFAELVTKQFEKPDGPEMKRVLGALRALDRESQKLSRLVAQLLDLTRIEAGQLVLDRRPTDVGQLVHNIAESAQMATNKHTLRVSTADTVTALVDPLRLEQVVTNLLSNAIKFSPAGGPIDIEVSQPTASTASIAVQDRGIGILDEHRPRIFERFYQTRSDDAITGMGLGLYISRRIVELHGGQIEAESCPDRGTRFTVILPVA